MGMDPITKGMLGSAAAGTVGGLFAPEGQEIQGFAGANHPNLRLSQAYGGTEELMKLVAGMDPPQFGSSYVQQPGVYSGGGLPFDIGVTGSDEANPFHSRTPPGHTGGGVYGGGGGGGGGGGDGSQTGGWNFADFIAAISGGGGGGGGGEDRDRGNPPDTNWNQFPGDPRPPIIPAPPAVPIEGIGVLPPVTGGGGGDDSGDRDGDGRGTGRGVQLPPEWENPFMEHNPPEPEDPRTSVEGRFGIPMTPEELDALLRRST